MPDTVPAPTLRSPVAINDSHFDGEKVALNYSKPQSRTPTPPPPARHAADGEPKKEPEPDPAPEPTDEEVERKIEENKRRMKTMLGSRMKRPVKLPLASNAVLALIISHWDPVCGPTAFAMMEHENHHLDEGKLEFLSRFALISAVGNQVESDGISFTSLPQLSVGVTSMLFRAPVITLPDGPTVQYCLTLVVQESITNRYVYLSNSVNDRLFHIVWKFQHLLKDKAEKPTQESVMRELLRYVNPFLQHLDAWLPAAVPPNMPVSQTIFGDPPSDRWFRDFLAQVITTHLTFHQRTIVRGSDPRQVNMWIRALLLVSSPEAWQLSALLPEKRERAGFHSRVPTSPMSAVHTSSDPTIIAVNSPVASAHEEGSPSGVLSPGSPFGQSAGPAAARPYVPDLYIQGITTSTPIPDADVQLSRFPSCIIDVDSNTISVCKPLNNYTVMREHNMYETKKSAKQAPTEGLLFTTVQQKSAVFVKNMVSVLLQVHPCLRAGFAMESRRLYFRRAAAMVVCVHDTQHSEGAEAAGADDASAQQPAAAAAPPQGMQYLSHEDTRNMKSLLDLPTDEDLNVVLSAAELLCPGTYAKVCGNPMHVADIAEIVKSMGVGI
ncbi:hypothetical protein DIPPA_27308 [Diplonema papillatum]|nr:hypothetical protein DIPPA_27308 [Diplonema papillatum]